jgi:hypothetical protein
MFDIDQTAAQFLVGGNYDAVFAADTQRCAAIGHGIQRVLNLQ